LSVEELSRSIVGQPFDASVVNPSVIDEKVGSRLKGVYQ